MTSPRQSIDSRLRASEALSSAAVCLPVLGLLALINAQSALAHGVSGADQSYLVNVEGVNIAAFMYLGAKHMITGYDHLLYLAGVIFFLRGLPDIVKLVSLFALGHSLTLLTGVLAGITVNPFIVDAIIGLSICYKALENLQLINWTRPEVAVFGFGLVHGLGLSSKLQDLSLSEQGLIWNMLGFNVGVELGQIIALAYLFFLLNLLRRTKAFDSLAVNVNVVLFAAGVFLCGFQTLAFLFSGDQW